MGEENPRLRVVALQPVLEVVDVDALDVVAALAAVWDVDSVLGVGRVVVAGTSSPRGVMVRTGTVALVSAAGGRGW